MFRRRDRPALARLKGLEPLTRCLEGSCSIRLSYRRVSQPARSPRVRGGPVLALGTAVYGANTGHLADFQPAYRSPTPLAMQV